MSDYHPVDEPLGGSDALPQPAREHLGQFVSLHYIAKVLARRKRTWMIMATVGFLVGLSLPTLIPAKYSAQSTLLMFHNPADDPSKDMATDVALLESEVVAQKVINDLGLATTAQKLVGEYSGTAITDQVLQISISAPTEADAIDRANVLDNEFLSFRSELFQKQNQQIVDSLNNQIKQLNSSITSETNSINGLGTPVPNSPEDNLLQTTENVRNQNIGQVTTLQQTVQADDLTTTSIIDQSQVESPATAVTESSLKTLVIDGASGLIAGVALGLGVVVLFALTSDRIRQRDEVSNAALTPVELSVGKFGNLRILRKRRLRRKLSDPGKPVELMARYLRSVVHAVPSSKKLALVSVDSLEPSALSLAILAGRLAVFEGQRVMVMDLSPRRILGELLGVSEPETRIVFVKGAWVPVLVSVPAENDPVVELPQQGIDLDGMPGTAWTTPEVVLVLATLDPGIGAGHLRPVVDEAVLVVTAGRSNAAQVRAAAEMLRAAGVRVRSAILVGADYNDDSLGLARVDHQRNGVPEGLGDLMGTTFISASEHS